MSPHALIQLTGLAPEALREKILSGAVNPMRLRGVGPKGEGALLAVLGLRKVVTYCDRGATVDVTVP